jgi:HAD superfamily hydrolase (TIGR01509 family)
MSRWIVFDAMGVIFEEGEDILNRLIPFLRGRGFLRDPETVHAAYRHASLGQISGRQFWEILGLRTEYPWIEYEYLDTCLPLDPQFIKIAEKLAADFSLAILSNDVPEWAAHLRKKHKLDRLIRTPVISGEVGVRKPSLEIYQILLDRCRARGRECIFVDDRISNLEPAAALGMIPVWMAKTDASSPAEIPFRIRSLSELPPLALRIFSDTK